MSDDALDKEWKPNGRPQSTIARSFSAALNDVFKIDNSLADLDAAVDQKKKAVSSQTSELEALEAQLRATEERLKQRQAMGYTCMSNRGPPIPRRRTTIGDPFSMPQADGEESQKSQASPLGAEFQPKAPLRLATGQKEAPQSNTSPLPTMPGVLPPTPGASEGESANGDEDGDRVFADYVVITKDGDLPPPVPPPRSVHRPAS